MKRFFPYLLIILILALSSGADAGFRAPEFSFNHFSTDDGLPSNRIRDIVQDAEGFVWFATDAGLVRYDGTSVRVFTPYGDNRPAGEIYIMSICRDGYRLIVGTDQNLYSYNPLTERLELFNLKYSTDIRERLEGEILDICVDTGSTIWVSVAGKGVFQVGTEGEVLANHQFPQNQNFIGKLHADADGSIWGVSSIGEGGLYRFDRNAKSFEPVCIRIEGSPASLRSLALTSDGNGTYWLGTWENGLVRFNALTREGEFVGPRDSAEMWHIHSLTQFIPGIMLVGSDSGLTVVDTNTGEWQRYTHDELNPKSLNDRFVYPIMVDTDGGLWIGTYYRGVNYQSRGARRFQKFSHSRFVNSISGNVVTRFCEDRTGMVWIGTADGGLCSFNPATRQFRHYPLISPKISDNINAICADNSRIWVGTYSKGAGWLDPKSGNWTPVPVEGYGTGYSCFASIKDRKGDIWVGVTETLGKYNREKNAIERVSNLNAWISDIAEDPDGSLWIATQGRGLYRYYPASKKWTNHLASGRHGDLPHNHINNVIVDESGHVYAGTIYGIYQYDRDKNSFLKVGNESIPSAINSIERDADELWAGTSNGLLCLGKKGRARGYSTADGICDNQFVAGASMKASDGKLYFGTVNGLCIVDPQAINMDDTPVKIRFTGLDIINEPITVGDERLPVSLNHLDKLTLSHSDHTFSIYFSALDYSSAGGKVYRYQLDGFDKEWIETDRENRATYSNLPPGTYTLRVQTADKEGAWSEEEATLKIVVKPAWYASIWMKILYAAIIIMLLYTLMHFVIGRVEKEHKSELERVTSNKEKEMFRSKLAFFTVVAHEIRTPVSLIIGPLDKVMESKEKFAPAVKEDLNIIRRNAHRLLSLVNQLLDFKKVEENDFGSNFRPAGMMALTEGVAERFRPSMEHKGIMMEVEYPDGEFEADVDTEAVTKLISNLINNARKFTKDLIRVELSKLPDGRNFIISVADNGIGISKENQDKVFRPFFQVLDNINEAKGGTGLGLSIVKNVADAHGGSVTLESEPGAGAKFTVTLPVRQEKVIPAEMIHNAAAESSPVSADTVITEDDRKHTKPVLLVVDDNEEMVQFISSYFEKDYEIATAFNGKEALDVLGSLPVALVVCDWMMPVMDGVELLKIVRGNENFCHIPFVMLTARTDNVSKIETMRCGADAYVEKPFSIGFLEARIANLLEMRQRLQKKYAASPLTPIVDLAPTPLDDELLRKLQSIIEENFSNPELNVDFLVDKMGIGRSSLYSKIRTLADVSPNELIQITRLKKAAELLKDGRYRINEVSYMVGFASTSYFSRCFQKQFGIRPTDFTQKNQSSSPNPTH